MRKFKIKIALWIILVAFAVASGLAMSNYCNVKCGGHHCVTSSK